MKAYHSSTGRFTFWHIPLADLNNEPVSLVITLVGEKYMADIY